MIAPIHSLAQLKSKCITDSKYQQLTMKSIQTMIPGAIVTDYKNALFQLEMMVDNEGEEDIINEINSYR